MELDRMQKEKQLMSDNLQKSANDVSQQLAEVTSFNSKLEKQKQVGILHSYLSINWLVSVSIHSWCLIIDPCILCIFQSLEERMKAMEETKSSIESDLQARSSELTSVTSQLQEYRDLAEEKEQELSAEIECLRSQLEQSQRDKETLEARMGMFHSRMGVNWKPLFLLPNEIEKHYASIRKHS